MATTPIFPDAIKTPAIEIDNADGTTILDFITGGSSGSRIDGINVTTDDTTDIDLIVYHNDGTSDFKLGVVNIPAGSGTDGTNPPVSLLTQANFPLLKDDLAFYLEATDKIRVAATATLTAAKVAHLVGQVGDY